MHSAVNNLIRGTRLALFAIPRQGGHVSVGRHLFYIHIYIADICFIYIYMLICLEVCPGCSDFGL